MAVQTLDQVLEVLASGNNEISDAIILDPTKEATVAVERKSTDRGGSTVQVTVSSVEDINAETALWVEACSGAESGFVKLARPVTGVRFVSRQGDWRFQIRQA